MKNKILKKIFSCSFIILIIVISLELLLIMKNSSMSNYDIEMWKYSKKLKTKSNFDVLGHEHKKSTKAILQSVEISLNNYGLRHYKNITKEHDLNKRILMLGSSITLGWGVDQSNTFSSKLEKKLKKNDLKVEVLNAGIGNYNTERYVNLFFLKLKELKPTDIIVNYFINDIEILKTPKENLLLKNSQLAATIYNIIQKYRQNKGLDSLSNYYKKLYDINSINVEILRKSLTKLSNLAKNEKINLYLTMMPDTFNLENYKFVYVHKLIEEISKELNYKFIDLYPIFKGKSKNEIWVKYNDPHPNEQSHEAIANEIYGKIN